MLGLEDLQSVEILGMAVVCSQSRQIERKQLLRGVSRK
jgi:hypothetical protein